VLRAIGQTAVEALDVSSAAAFSLPPGASVAEVLLFDSAGDVFETTIVECSRRPPKPPAGDGPVIASGEELEWLLGAISPRLGHQNRYWICLEADGVCIGGVVWGAQSGEAQRLSTQTQELLALASGWGLAMRTSQIREEARTLSEQLAEANRQLQTAQAELLRSKTMTSVGEMAAGAAHEMNNPLAVISGRSQILASQLSDPKLKAAAHLIHEQSHRLSEIITELMDFAKPTPAQPVQTDLADLLDRALHEAKLHSDVADRDIEVTIADVPPVLVDPQQVSAALVEVIDNAIHATAANKGRVSIHCAYDVYSKRVVLTVSDNGCGMDDATQKRAFDPFFSAKPAGRRRGMGLPKALRWIESSGGSMRLESRPNQGTRTIVLLPSVQPPADEQKAARCAPEGERMVLTKQPVTPTAVTRPRVLVVDDEPALIQLVRDVVGKATNCRLFSAGDLREAQAIIDKEQIDLMLTDVRLPDGNGMSLLRRLHDAQPTAAAVVITGNPSIDGAISAIRSGVVDFLPKPFSAEHLLERVNRALAQQAVTARNSRRLGQLKVAVKRLNVIRRTITKKVDILCNDLVSAYGELSKQVDHVRIQDGFRKAITRAKDLEQLLCHAMDWMLRHVGYCNVAVWLASDQQQFELGAYMKYTIPGDKELTESMRHGMLPLITRENMVLLEGETIRQQLTPPEFEYLHNQSIMGSHCTYLGESLAALVLFRDARAPFTDSDVAAIQSISPIFAVALAEVVRESEGGGDGNPFYDDTRDHRDDRSDRDDRDRRNEADWWKRGEAPPF
jgi:signal transduction histidine kinase/FixJ family two-component response regulator